MQTGLNSAGEKTYVVKEIFYSIQGEGANTGRSAVFVRFAGCNLWSGREQDRRKAVCQFCDTDFRNGTRMTLKQIVDEVRKHPTKLVIFTGGEPALQLDQQLVDRLHKRFGWTVAVETNGTRPLPAVQWVCVSPKAGTEVVIDRADELKLVYPQAGLSPDSARALVHAPIMWLSPMDGPNFGENVAAAIAFVSMDLRWRLNIQAHKVWRVR